MAYGITDTIVDGRIVFKNIEDKDIEFQWNGNRMLWEFKYGGDYSSIAIDKLEVSEETVVPATPPYGRIVLFYREGKFYYKDYSGNVTEVGSGGGGVPGGNNTEVQFNDAGSFGGDVDFAYDKTIGCLIIKELKISSITDIGIVQSGATGFISSLKSEFNKNVSPTVNDDNIAGYAKGSRWLDTHAFKEFLCSNPATGAAIWLETTNSPNQEILYPEYDYLVIKDNAANNDIDVELVSDDLLNDGQYYKFCGQPGTGGKQGVTFKIRILVPNIFKCWESNAVEIRFSTKDINVMNNSLDIYIGKVGDGAYSYQDLDNVSSNDGIWDTITILDTDIPGVFVGGDILEFKMIIYSDSSSYVKLGEIKFNFE